MLRVPSAASYDTIRDFGALYDAVTAHAKRGDIAFYREEALRETNRVLEIGCGTGRVLVPIAEAGREITGLDGSVEMLARCHARLAEDTKEVRGRVTLEHGDATDFALGTTFPLIIAPFRILQMFTTMEQQLGCVQSVARHLAPGGRFLFDVYNPHFELMLADRSAEREDTPEITLPDGRTFRRTYRVTRARLAEQINDLEMFYYVDGRAHRHAFSMRWYMRAELEHLLARAGLRLANVYGDFDRSAYGEASPEIVVEAELI